MNLTELNHLIDAATATISETIWEIVKSKSKRKRKIPYGKRK